MSLFNLFKKKPQGPVITDKVYVSLAAKEQACIQMAKDHQRLTFIAWSEQTYQHFQKLLIEKHQLFVEVMLAYNVMPTRMRGKNVVFLEHQLDRKKEIDLLKLMNYKEALFLSSFDDPIFLLFKSDRIKTLMERMGHDDNESIEHAMVAKSIGRAQEKMMREGLPDDCPESVKKWLALIK